MRMSKTCKMCDHFIGAGDWNLCCTQRHEGYPFGFLCYEDTPACAKFQDKAAATNKTEGVRKDISKTVEECK